MRAALGFVFFVALLTLFGGACGGGEIGDNAGDAPSAPSSPDAASNAGGSGGMSAAGGAGAGGCTPACAANEVCLGGSCLCQAPFESCAGECVDARSSPFHCGGCGIACAPEEFCSDGQCVASCPPDRDACGRSCVDTNTDSANCGDCGAGCPSGQACQSGTCGCPADRTLCGAACVDTNVDVAHCGGCSAPCANGQTCSAGQCQCPSGRTLCNGVCVDTASDASHCGGCGLPCAATEVCSASACAGSCAMGLTQCGQSCVDFATDSGHCGGCDNACPLGQSCQSSQCVCPTGQSPCDGACVDTQADEANCGGCGQACPLTQSCSGGGCVCPAGRMDCGGGLCPDTLTDVNNCGDCNVRCPTGQVCGGGNCECPSGQALCDAACVDTRSSNAHCGGCDQPCGAGEACAAGVCRGGVLSLSAIPANTTVGLEWPRVPGATSYRVYWSTAPGVGTQAAMYFDSAEPATVHRGLTNGTTYYYVVTATTATGEGPASNEVSETPQGEWVLEELGAGDFSDVLTGGRVPRIPVENRVHILLLAEGYLSSELSTFHTLASHTGTRANDVDRWVDEIFGIEPYSNFREAFVVWYLPRASTAHIGQGSTAFNIVVTSGSVSDTNGAAAPLWAALDTAGSDAFLYPPGVPVVNHIAAFLLFDPSRNRAGFSGRTTTLTNPSNSQQRIRSAFALGHAHEFTHAFSNLRDEYLENDNTVTSTSETSNVAHVNTCGLLPWAHLFVGAGINTTQGLVGAFGRPQRGYHSELFCLLNGTHENGDYYCSVGDSLTLRSNTRMCNFCREITAYRVFDRTGLLPGTSGFDIWKMDYRAAFYQRFGFRVPATVPQTYTCPGGSPTPLYEACVP